MSTHREFSKTLHLSGGTQLALMLIGLLFNAACGGTAQNKSDEQNSDVNISKAKDAEVSADVPTPHKYAGNNGDERLITIKKPEDTTFTARATNRFDGKAFVQQGTTPSDAIKRALALCNTRDSFDGYGGTCTISKQFTAKLLPRANGNIPAEWACKVQENKPLADSAFNRSWPGPAAKTVHEAMANAMKKCAQKAGIECQIVKCVNTDFGKSETLVMADNAESDG